jgi:hypothetical protein
MSKRPSYCCLLVAFLFGGCLAPEAAATSISLGELTVRSQPGAEVVWDGVILGVTDDRGVMKIGQIPPGGYLLDLRLEGFEDRTVPLAVETGSQTLNLPLTALVAAKPAAVESDPVSRSSDETTLSAPTQTIWPTALAAIVIVVAAIAIFRLARQRPQPASTVAQTDGPKVVLGSPGHRSGRSSGLLRDLKRREDSLENFVEAGSGGLKKEVLNREVVNHRPVDEPSGGER